MTFLSPSDSLRPGKTFIAAQNLQPTVRLSVEPKIAANARIKQCQFGVYTEVGESSVLTDTVVEDYSYLGHYCDVMGADIDRFSNIASMVRINPGFHPMERPSLHHFTYRPVMYGFAEEDEENLFHWRRLQRVKIGRDTWIGHGAIIMPGVTVGHGAVVGSGSIVTRDVPPYAIAAGNPAKVIRMRFNPALIEAIEATRWWEWDHEVLRERLEDFRDLRSFLRKYAG